MRKSEKWQGIIVRLFPTRKQWKAWKFLSKLTAIAGYASLLALIISIIPLVPLLFPSRPGIKELSNGDLQLRVRVYQEVCYICSAWGQTYFFKYGNQFKEYEGQLKSRDLWGVLQEAPVPEFSLERWQYYRPLFAQHSETVRKGLEQLLMAHSNILPSEFKTLVMDTQKSIEGQERFYAIEPWLRSRTDEDRNRSFGGYFHELAKIIGRLCKEAERLQKEDQQLLKNTR